jgi:hypothetical protein
MSKGAYRSAAVWTLLVVSSAISSVVSTVVLAHVRITYTPTVGAGSAPQTILIGHGRYRSDYDKSSSVIVDPAAGVLFMLDHDARTFTRIGGAEVDRMLTVFGDAKKRTDQGLARMSPARRERAQRELAELRERSLMTVVDTGDRSTVAGIECRVWQMRLQGRTVHEECMADASVLKLSATDRATLAAVTEWGRAMSDKWTKSPAWSPTISNPFAAFLSGLALRSTTIANDGTRGSSEVAVVTTGDLPSDLFRVPYTYQEQSFDGLFGVSNFGG